MRNIGMLVLKVAWFEIDKKIDLKDDCAFSYCASWNIP